MDTKKPEPEPVERPRDDDWPEWAVTDWEEVERAIAELDKIPGGQSALAILD
ncbi:MAG TPA: hypothetical protein VH183_05375 [Burkholderiaceae bacterium]|jgi:hypothetical protein|nr:hypothetical protein [Burkholderiaceae bacterium]